MTIGRAIEFISQHHRHHKKTVGGLFAVGVENEHGLVGVAIVGRPVARMANDGYTAEVTRLCVTSAKNACSMLYNACARAARALGYRRLITYILKSESGISLKGAGWTLLGVSGGGSWSRLSRARIDKHPTEEKLKYVKELNVSSTDTLKA